jgi:hypothetical protein
MNCGSLRKFYELESRDLQSARSVAGGILGVLGQGLYMVVDLSLAAQYVGCFLLLGSLNEMVII